MPDPTPTLAETIAGRCSATLHTPRLHMRRPLTRPPAAAPVADVPELNDSDVPKWLESDERAEWWHMHTSVNREPYKRRIEILRRLASERAARAAAEKAIEDIASIAEADPPQGNMGMWMTVYRERLGKVQKAARAFLTSKETTDGIPH